MRATSTSSHLIDPAGHGVVRPARTRRDELIDAVERRVLNGDTEYKHFGGNSSRRQTSGLLDYLFSVDDEPHLPEQVFHRLRWGGQFVYLSQDRSKVAALPEQFRNQGFDILHAPGYVRNGRFSLLCPFLARKLHYFVARKVLLIPPGDISQRFTYQVQLDGRPPTGDGYVVRKEVPTLERVMARLRKKFPNVCEQQIEKRARKFTDKIFPVFLTREAAILQILRRDLPSHYAARVPRLLHMEQDERGFVRRLWMTWLRNGGEPLTQIDFAKQATDLLRSLHEDARVVHLDLRLDNVVITPEGVGFVDFGSAVRLGEEIKPGSLLSTLFGELMRTSQIQRMLEQMTTSGQVTNSAIANGYQKVDPAVDFFYLALQISAPHGNPDLADLIRFNRADDEAVMLNDLTQEILKPRDPENPPYRSAKDIFWAIKHIETAVKWKRRRESRQRAGAPA